MGNNLPLAIALMGPTASGKTELALSLRKILDAEIISVDSALVYRGLNIGAAKPSSGELTLAPHRLIDIRDPAEPYSVAEFCQDATREIAAICENGKTPLLVGGTMLYFKSLFDGLADMPSANAKVREKIEDDAKRFGWEYIHRQLEKVDPATAQRIHPNHSQRLSRALEVYLVSGVPFSEFQSRTQGGLKDHYRWLQIGLAPRDRKNLHQRIAVRFDKMLEAGLVDEVKQLYQRGDLHTSLPAIRAVGYRQVWDYLAGESTYNEMRDKGLAATRQLAKRQLTWLRAWPSLNWLYIEDKSGKTLTSDEIVNKALSFLNKTPL